MIVIREATYHDSDVIYKLINALAKHHGQEEYVNTTKKELERSAFSQKPKLGAKLTIKGFCHWNV